MKTKLQRAKKLYSGWDLPASIRRLVRYASVPEWYLFKLKHVNYQYRHDVDVREVGKTQPVMNKEDAILSILNQNGGARFLEIGIGEFPNIQRLKLMRAKDIKYTACDFQAVCEGHQKEITKHQLEMHNIRFLPNRVGTYAWTLFDLLQQNEQFDIIYLDGHHTFYVDLPAFMLAHQLLRPGGYFLIDDIAWTLNFLKDHMLHSFGDWRFYRKIYSFTDYEPDQQKLPHMRMIAEQFLIGRLGYLKLDTYSTPLWWALQRPVNE